jgi:hypothetical protein
MPLVRSLAFMIWAGCASLWIVAAAVFVFMTWESSTREIHQVFEQRERGCISRYADVQARERCLIIIDLERFQSRSIAIFNRSLMVLAPPLLGFGAVLFLHRRQSRPARRKR